MNRFDTATPSEIARELAGHIQDQLGIILKKDDMNKLAKLFGYWNGDARRELMHIILIDCIERNPKDQIEIIKIANAAHSRTRYAVKKRDLDLGDADEKIAFVEPEEMVVLLTEELSKLCENLENEDIVLLNLRFIDEHTVDEIALMLQKSPRTIYRRLADIISILRDSWNTRNRINP